MPSFDEHSATFDGTVQTPQGDWGLQMLLLLQSPFTKGGGRAARLGDFAVAVVPLWAKFLPPPSRGTPFTKGRLGLGVAAASGLQPSPFGKGGWGILCAVARGQSRPTAYSG
jgi:hypothetical protein